MFRSSNLRSLSAACAVCISLASRPSAAQGTAAAEALFNDARKAMDAKDYDTACKRFRESNRLDPAVGTMLNLATCEDKRGHVATAWELFRGALEKLPPSDPRHDYAKAQVDRLEPRLPHVTLTLAAGAPADTKVRDGDVIYSGAAFGLPLPVDPGKHDLVIEAEGRETRTLAVEIREAATMTIEIVPGGEKVEPSANAQASAAQADVRVTSPTVDEGGFGKKQWGFVAGGVGVVGIGVGITTGIMALGKKSTTDEQCSEALQRCSQEGHDAASSGRTLAAVSTVGWIVGALGVGAGVYLILSSGSEKGPATALQTTALPGGAGLTLKHRF
jgi:hypothetical protein